MLPTIFRPEDFGGTLLVGSNIGRINAEQKKNNNDFSGKDL